MIKLPLQLTLDERAVAHALWEAMVFAASPSARDNARLQMADAPFCIQQAILREIINGLRQGQELGSLPNPFAPA